MRKIGTAGAGISAKTLLCAAVITLFGCGDEADDARKSLVISDAPVSRDAYSGALAIRIAESIPTTKGDSLPVTLFLGFEPETESRLGINAFLDLRELQRALPERLSGTLDPDCGLGLDITLDGVAAEGNQVRGKGSVLARLYRCRDRDTPEEQRGMRLLSQTIQVEALASAKLEDDCIRFELANLQLDPHGFLGGLANLFGITERARTALLAKAAETLDETPICPEFPPALNLLEPKIVSGGAQEIPSGGLGADLKGSIDLSAETIVALFELAQAKGLTPEATDIFPPASRPSASFRIDETLTFREQELPYGLDLRLSAVAKTRIGAEAILDLRELQPLLPDLLADTVLMDSCGTRLTLKGLKAEAEGANVIATGALELDTFTCDRTAPGTWERGPLESSEAGNARFVASAELIGECVTFRLIDVTRDPPLPVRDVETGGGRTEAIKVLLLEAVGLLLEDIPLCPELPDELDLLEPHFYRGQPQEVGEGGIGVALDGSIDVSTTTLIAVLGLLQEKGILPPRP